MRTDPKDGQHAESQLAILQELFAGRRTHLPVKMSFSFIALGLAYAIAGLPAILVLAAVFLPLELALLYHARHAAKIWRMSGRAVWGLLVHRWILVLIYDLIIILVALDGRFISQIGALLMLAAQGFYMLSARSAFLSLMLPDLVGIVVTAVFMAFAAGGWATPDEQIIFSAGLLTICGFMIMAALQSLRMHSQLRAATETLAEAQRAGLIGHLTGGIAHDFNNLLTVMRGNIDLIRELPVAEQPALLAEIEDAVQRGGELVARLSEAGRGTGMTPTKSSVRQAAQRAAGMARRTLPANVRIELFLASDPVIVSGTAVELEMVLLNLFSNAADALPHGGQIKLHVVPLDEEHVRIRVADNGQGIPEEILARVTDPYVTTKPPGRGTGLGLSMVKSYVDEAGGDLSIQSSPGTGTAVLLDLPLAAPLAEVHAAQ